ncbi:MAG: putative Zn-dependent protease [Cyclobacteriaceae bacterium]|jgi:predicted Zn-dependent protease
MKYLSSILLICTAMFLYDCATVPITGRRQLNLVSNSEIIPMSFQQYGEVLKTSKLSTDKKQTAMIKNVGDRIKTAVEQYMKDNNASDQLEGFGWEFNLIEEDVQNAWCMPGGKVAFYTGIMSTCKTETGVAVVMGHEVAHAIANHGRERMSQGLLTQGALGGLSAAMGQNPTGTQELLMQSIGAGTQIGMLKFSRQHESEADKLGLIFMAIAGYDPNEAPDFWGRMSSGGGEQPPEFMSTHPSHDTRISDLKAQIPNALKYYEANKGKY